jgi:uncharacterized protein YjiS (DUF1127 family)
MSTLSHRQVHRIAERRGDIARPADRPTTARPFWRRAYDWYLRRRLRNTTYHELMDLDDRTLDDIGVMRSEIAALAEAYAAAETAPATPAAPERRVEPAKEDDFRHAA